MNKLIWIFVIFIILICCNQNWQHTHPHNDLYFDNLNGVVEKVEETSFAVDISGKIMSADSCCKTIIQYNNKGYRTRYSNTAIDGTERNGQIYSGRFPNGMVKELKFIENGHLVSILRGTLNKKGIYGDSYIYDSSGKLISFYSDIIINEFGKIISMKNFKPDSTLRHTIVNNYSNHIWSGGYIKDSAGNEISSTFIKLNKLGESLEMLQCNSVNGLRDTTHVKYVYDSFDDHDNWIQRFEINMKNNSSRFVKRQIIYSGY